MSEIVTWLLGGGLATVLALLVKTMGELNKLQVERAAMHAKEAEYKAVEAGSSTKVAGEDIFKGLMRTIVQREQEAHELTSMVQQQLVEERKHNADTRERYAAMCEKEEFLLRTNGQLLIQIKDIQAAHSVELKIYRVRLKTATQRLLALGETFSATDVVGEPPSNF